MKKGRDTRTVAKETGVVPAHLAVWMWYRDNDRIRLQDTGDDQSILSSEKVKAVLNAHALDCRRDADCKELG